MRGSATSTAADDGGATTGIRTRCWNALDVTQIAAPHPALPGAMKRYPRRASVSMKMGVSADSPSASRNLLMAAFRL